MKNVFRTEGTTMERVSEWNMYGGKPAPELGDSNLVEVVNKQIERIQEEATELKDALNESNTLEILDAICDLDVTICGLFFLSGYNPDNYTQQRTIDSFQDQTPDLGNVFFTLNILKSALNNFNDDASYGTIFVALELFKIYANRIANYDGAINAVLNNNDDKFYVGDKAQDAFIRAAELTVDTDEDYTVEITLPDPDMVKYIDFEDMDIDRIADMGAVFSVHRESDDKICKPKDFVGVDLKPFIK